MSDHRAFCCEVQRWEMSIAGLKITSRSSNSTSPEEILRSVVSSIRQYLKKRQNS
ncbi:hypothetical protein [Leptolyngbya sp. GGD]|uniref:hypothetical protein n=1 Tax=Leptolyngbya sp. GGD TaxID=2997907 RepID=UPI0019A1AD72|nr:hypothetical protein [Leptolyngbya sp. GGD]MBD1856393.1 hypothetical protein [Leptolyngbya sp. FACHB-1624]MCY6489362.1 hypothetical protein [Leptolyngbya sp. GGD]